MKKVLFTAKVDSHIANFHIPYNKWFKDMGYEVHVASNGDSCIPYVDVKYNLNFERNPLSFKNLKVYFKLKQIINDNKYEIIHCHTPIGGALTRLASKKARKDGCIVIYTAHGFHFLNGGGKINWLIFYPIEKFLAKYTDCLITINQEDYNLAVKKNFKSGEIKLVNGVGVDLDKYTISNEKEKKILREKNFLSNNDFVLIYVAELNSNKNQGMAIDAIDTLRYKIGNIKLLLVGEGILKEEYKEKITSLGLQNNIYMLGQRNDVNELLKLSDVAISTSRREGLPRNIMEAMATGLPIIVTNSRGNRDLVSDKLNGYVIGIDEKNELAEKINILYEDINLRKSLGQKSLELVDKYSLKVVFNDMVAIYKRYIKS